MTRRDSVSAKGDGPLEPLGEAACAWLERAEAQWRRWGRAGVDEAVKSCEAALAGTSEIKCELRARIWLRRGQILESGREEAQLREAVRSHEAGLAELARRGGAGDGVDGVRPRRLAAQLWMNRGNALLALGKAESAREAARSYDAALKLTEAEAVDAGEAAEAGGEAERRAMRGAAWLNRAEAIRLSGGESARTEEGRCLEKAVEELRAAASAGLGAARRNLAGAWLNRAAWLEAAGEGEVAAEARREAVRAAEPEARRDRVALEAGLQARHALCVAAGKRLTVCAEAPGEAERAEIVAQVEAGLADFAAWRGEAESAREVATRLFEFGAWFFRLCEPRRLPEFLAAHTDRADARWVEAARVAIQMARQEILQAGFAELLDEVGLELRVRLQALRAVETSLPGGLAR